MRVLLILLLGLLLCGCIDDPRFRWALYRGDSSHYEEPKDE